jgi:hypothetical protein
LERGRGEVFRVKMLIAISLAYTHEHNLLEI